ncbi:MAG: hypothetical protein AB1649_07275 [Chloroflexota bacterium]
MRKISALFMVFAFLISACTFTVEVQTPTPGSPSPEGSVSLPTQTIWFSTPLLTLPPVESPSATPTVVAAAPRFLNATFTIDPIASPSQKAFPADTTRVYAVWDYQNMRAGLTIRRDWYHNNVLWITREEAWDFSKYGADGTIRDISVYDTEGPLTPGEYRLELYIDSKPQPIGGGVVWPTFTISEDASFLEEVRSPDESWTAFVRNPNKLMVLDPDRNSHQLFWGNEIFNLAWLPDGKHLLFVDRDRSQQGGVALMGVLDDLWIVNVVTGETRALSRGNSPLLQRLIISPDGRYVATVEGSGFGDACTVDSKVVIFHLSEDLREATPYEQDDFTGIPAGGDMSVLPVHMGNWMDNTRFRISLDFTCTTDTSLKGIYVFDISDLSVEKED